jgi:hypothetical protein
MNRKYKITEFVKCYANRGQIRLNGEIGKVIGYNKDGAYNVLFAFNRFDLGSGFYLTLFEDELRHKDEVLNTVGGLDVTRDIVFLPSGEVVRIDRKHHLNLISRFIIKWDLDSNCYIADDKKKDSILKNI